MSDLPGKVQQDVAMLLSAQPSALGLTWDECQRIAAWLADHRGLPPGWVLADLSTAHVNEPFRKALARQGFRLAAAVSPHHGHVAAGDLRSDCPECVADMTTMNSGQTPENRPG